MNINRQNYETFFLLYTDNELSAAEKKQVDEFVEANTDLQEELVMLQQSILKPEDVVFEDYECLFRKGIAAEGIQEKLLLLLDNELPEVERTEIEGLIRSDQAIRDEWHILQQTKLQAVPAIVFKDKRSLYRKEPGRLVAFPWQRIAAAAVLAGFALWGTMFYLNRTITTAPPIVNVDKPAAPSRLEQPAAPAEASNTEASPPKMDKLVAVVQPKTRKPSKAVTIKVVERPLQLPQSNERLVVNIKQTNDLSEPSSDNLNTQAGNEITPSPVTNEKRSQGNNEIAAINEQPSAAYMASAVSLKDSEENNDDHILFMDEDKIKKTKLGGIFRRVKRVLERKTNIKPGGNNIRVANLEFAIQ